MPFSATIYAWVVVFILPINSALNPIIYTIAAPTSIRRIIHSKLRSVFRKVRCTKSKYCPCCPSKFDETRSMADSTATYVSEMLGVNNNKKRASSDGSVISMALLTTPFLSANGSRRTSFEFRRNSYRSDCNRSESGRPEFTKCEFEKSDLTRRDSGRSECGRRYSSISSGSRRTLKILENNVGNGSLNREGFLRVTRCAQRQRSFDSFVNAEGQRIDNKIESVQLKPMISVTKV